MGREEEIRLIAYRIWEEEGSADGRDFEHWLRAEAIWEESQKEPVLRLLAPVVESVKTKPKQAVKRSAKRSAKRTTKTSKSKKI